MDGLGHLEQPRRHRARATTVPLPLQPTTDHPTHRRPRRTGPKLRAPTRVLAQRPRPTTTPRPTSTNPTGRDTPLIGHPRAMDRHATPPHPIRLERQHRWTADSGINLATDPSHHRTRLARPRRYHRSMRTRTFLWETARKTTVLCSQSFKALLDSPHLLVLTRHLRSNPTQALDKEPVATGTTPPPTRLHKMSLQPRQATRSLRLSPLTAIPMPVCYTASRTLSRNLSG